MDGLLSLLLAFFGTLSMLVILPMVTLLVGLIWLVAEVLLNLTFQNKSEEPVPATWLKRIPQAFGGFLLISGVASCLFLFTLDTFFYQDTLRWSLSRVQEKTRLRVSFQSAEGSLWTGKHTLYRLGINRRGHSYTNFNLRMEKLEIDLSVMDLFRFAMRVDNLALSKLKGTIHIKRSYAPSPPPQQGYGRRNFLFRKVSMASVDLKLFRGPIKKKKKVRLEIIDLKTTNVHSQTAWTDLMFRSKMRGHIQDHPFTVSMRTLSDGHETEWKLDNITPQELALLTGGPMRWFKEGQVNLRFRNRWAHQKRNDLSLDCRVKIAKPRAEIPKVVARSRKRIATPLVSYLNSQEETLKLSFQVNLALDRWKGNTPRQVQGLNKALWKGLRRIWRKNYKPNQPSPSKQLLKNLKKRKKQPKRRKKLRRPRRRKPRSR
jgi:hypothetical protein